MSDNYISNILFRNPFAIQNSPLLRKLALQY